MSHKTQVAYEPGPDVLRNRDVSPPNYDVVEESLEDDSTLSAATHYYPSDTGLSMFGYKDFSISGKIIGGAGVTVTLYVEMTNDEDVASGDWIKVYGYDDYVNTVMNEWEVTNDTLLFAISFNESNYKYARIVVVISGGTSNTVVLKGRRKAV